MRIIFAGTPIFAAEALAALVAAGHEIVLVLTQPDRPAGRGQSLRPSPVKQLARQHDFSVFQPPTLKDPAGWRPISEASADVMVVAAYGLILPQAVLDMPRYGCLNIHASLLPRWRGAAPIQRAIQAGDQETGVCIMQMEAGLDTGPVLLSEALKIGSGESAGRLHDRLAVLGARLIVEALSRLPTLPAQAQPGEGVTYAEKLSKQEAPLDWRRPAAQLARQVAAFDPVPGATAVCDGQSLKIWAACAQDGHGVPGEILSVSTDGLRVATADGVLVITELQKPGGRRLAIREFLTGSGLAAGKLFSLPT